MAPRQVVQIVWGTDEQVCDNNTVVLAQVKGTKEQCQKALQECLAAWDSENIAYEKLVE